MSKLELLILQCKRVWGEMEMDAQTIDNMIDNLLDLSWLDLSKVTDENIKKTTLDYINDKEKK